MQTKEWTKIQHNADFNIGLLHAYFVQHAYPRHSHDYYVISLIERGRQSFTHQGTKHFTASGGVILINPGAVHTGEAVDEQGFEMRSLYPTISHLQTAAAELTGHAQPLPFFKEVQIRDPWAVRSVLSLHKSMSAAGSTLEGESRFLWTLAQLIKRYADNSISERPLGKENKAIHRVRHYIDEHFGRGVSLQELAQYAALSPYYLLRVFRAEVGMPPHAYLESVRIRHAQRLLQSGKTLAEVALTVGFSSQSHMTRRFRKIIGVTPGQYAQQVRA